MTDHECPIGDIPFRKANSLLKRRVELTGLIEIPCPAGSKAESVSSQLDMGDRDRDGGLCGAIFLSCIPLDQARSTPSNEIFPEFPGIHYHFHFGRLV